MRAHVVQYVTCKTSLSKVNAITPKSNDFNFLEINQSRDPTAFHRVANASALSRAALGVFVKNNINRKNCSKIHSTLTPYTG